MRPRVSRYSVSNSSRSTSILQVAPLPFRCLPKQRVPIGGNQGGPGTPAIGWHITHGEPKCLAEPRTCCAVRREFPPLHLRTTRAGPLLHSIHRLLLNPNGRIFAPLRAGHPLRPARQLRAGHAAEFWAKERDHPSNPARWHAPCPRL